MEEQAGRQLLHVFVPEFLARLGQLVAVAYIGHVLGPVGFGVVGVAWAVYSFVVPLVQNAPEWIGTRELSQRSWRSSTIGHVQSIKLLGAVLALAGSAVGAAAIGIGSPAAEQLILQMAVLAGSTLFVGWVFRAWGRFYVFSWLRALQSVAFPVLLVTFLPAYPSPAAVPVLELGAVTLSAFVSHWLLNRCSHHRRSGYSLPLGLGRFRKAVSRLGRSVSYHGLAGSVNVAMWTLPIPIAAVFLTDAEVGYLSASFRLLLVVIAVMMLGLQVFFPILARLYRFDPAGARDVSAGLESAFIAAALGVSVVFLMFGEPLLHGIFGTQFADGAHVLRALAGVLLAGLAGAVYGQVLLANGRERVLLYVNAAAMIGAMVVVSFGLLLWPDPAGVSVMVLPMALHAVALGVLCRRYGYMDAAFFQWRRLRPAALMRLFSVR